MRAFVITSPNQWRIDDVPDPVPAPGNVVVDVERAGVCGTDFDLFTGRLGYFAQGHARFPLRIGHEWAGTVSAVGDGVDTDLLGRRTTGDTIIGCGRCPRCGSGRENLCEDRYEIGIRGGWPGALAEKVQVPARALHPLPNNLDATVGALVGPGGNAYRAILASGVAAGERLLIIGPGAVGLIAAMYATAMGVEVHLAGKSDSALGFARSLGFERVWNPEWIPQLAFDAVIDATSSGSTPATALQRVEPGKRVVLIGGGASATIDAALIARNGLTVIGVRGGSSDLDGTIEAFSAHAVDPRPLVAATVSLGEIGEILAGRKPGVSGSAPKIQVDPRLP